MNFRTLSLKYTLAGLLLLISLSVSAQKKEQSYSDSLLAKLAKTSADTAKISLYTQLAAFYAELGSNPAEGKKYAQKALSLSEKIKWDKGFAMSYLSLGVVAYSSRDYPAALNYLKHSSQIAGKINDTDNKGVAYNTMGSVYEMMQDKPHAIAAYLEAVKYLSEKKPQPLIIALTQLAALYYALKDNDKAIDYYLKAKKVADKSNDEIVKMGSSFHLNEMYTNLHDYEKALFYTLDVLKHFHKQKLFTEKRHELPILYSVSTSYANVKDYKNALLYADKTLAIAKNTNDTAYVAIVKGDKAWIYYEMGDYAAAYPLAKETLNLPTPAEEKLNDCNIFASILKDAPDSVLQKFGVKPGTKNQLAISYFLRASKSTDRDMLLDNYRDLSITYERVNKPAEAFATYKHYIALRDSSNLEKAQNSLLKKEKEIYFTKKEDSLKYAQAITNTQLRQKKQQSYFFMGGIAALLLLSVFIWLNFNNQRRSNKLLTNANDQLSEQREEITAQRDQLEGTLTDLKATQTQLIQSEKMASLGELTAGIAHEIQNPLNFVNNFSEVSTELLDELNDELDKGDVAEAKAIATDIKQNLEKIYHHGKRADGIVKGMLEHSRASTGQKEPTDLNKLADEYLRLAYHGLRAKDKSFNAELLTHFETGLPQANIIPQDIGRVLLNLFTNAFYAVQQKQATAGPAYKPTVEVITYTPPAGGWMVAVKDNGTGITNDVKEKIMQPFFTTKPTGQGTGLGLSLSYDIVVKGHGGKIDVTSTPGEGTTMIISLPL